MVDAGARSRLAASGLWDLHWFGSLDSTNAWALAQARQGAPAGLVAVADHQVAGRGRLGRAWQAPPGSSLLMSVLLRPDLDAEHLHLTTAVVAMAAADACRSEAGVDPGLKWPNDLLLAERKLAGVLAEADVEGGRVRAVVVGLGLNLGWPPGPQEGSGEADANELGALGGIALGEVAGVEVDRARLLAALLDSLGGRCRALEEPRGRLSQASEYRQRCVTVGRHVRAQLADDSVTGLAVDVTAEGHLLVDVGARLKRITAGDVVHVRPA
ncbi:MAG TPA: biotin--[acetyl-CoA-carboxylase] ligase [Acidimicrobiales bacterium]|nr:biotin--[acetyl-CoA-carboxylase] ligase [Acidimicrobiales bacterium]